MSIDLKNCDLSVFRKEVERIVLRNLTKEMQRSGRTATSIFPEFRTMLEWQIALHREGMAAPMWPRKYGGQDWDAERMLIFSEICAAHDAPQLTSMGIQMLGPILMKYGTERQKEELLPRILSGEDFWCQGYSEPSSGSDLGSLATKALRSNGHYIVNGSKIWTSLAHCSNKIFCLVKTAVDPSPKNSISFLLIDLDTPGIDIKRIVSLDGEVEQCEIFFSDVKVPVENIVGDENRGWEVALFLLEYERGGSSYHVHLERKLHHLTDFIQSDNTRQLLLNTFGNDMLTAEADILSLKYLERKIAASRRVDGNIGALSSLTKLIGTEIGQQLDEISISLKGRDAFACVNKELDPWYMDEVIGGEDDVAAFNSYINNRASTIYGGSAQIQRNIIAKRILGL